MELNQATLDFIDTHSKDDVRQLALQGKRNSDVDMPAALQQIAGIQAARRKVPSWAETKGLLYPPHLSMEQCSSESTARYKATLTTRLTGGTCKKGRLVDLTGGLGVDFSFMARMFMEAVYVERNVQLCAISSVNFPLLGLHGAVIENTGSEAFLEQLQEATLIYMDPARRSEKGRRTYAMEDCTPNVLGLLPVMLQKAPFLLLKLSPMLDISAAVTALNKAAQGRGCVEEVHVVAVGGECKELLFALSRTVESHSPLFYCVNDGKQFRFDTMEVRLPVEVSNPWDSLPLWLYEPDAAIMKAGCFGLLCHRFGVKAIAANSHLFWSKQPIEDFPGRTFCIDTLCSMNKKALRLALDGVDRANVSVRNFPMAAEQLRKRLKLKDGGERYIFATTLDNREHVLLIGKKTQNTSPDSSVKL